MRIDKVEIDGFGKLNHISLEFSHGFNLIVGDNESGKSTLCEFLLAMFYDLPNEGKRLPLSDTARKKYRPWKGEDFGGRVYFTGDDGVRYVLDKKFGATKRSDRARFLFADTWETAGSAENIGERLFHLGREGFLKTFYIKNLEADSREDGTEILTRLSNMETSGEEDVSYINIKNALDRAQLSILSKTGKGGRLAVLREEEKALEAEKQTYLHARERLREEEQKQADLFKKAESLAKMQEALDEKYQLAAEHEAYQAFAKAKEAKDLLFENLAAEEERLLRIGRAQEQLKDKEEIKVTKEEIEKCAMLEKKLIIAESKWEEEKKQRELDIEQNDKQTKKRTKVRTFVAAFIFVLFAFCGICLFSASKWAGIVSLALGVFVAGIIFALPQKTKEQEKFDFSNKDSLEEIEEIKQNLHALCTAYGVDSFDALRTLYLKQESIESSKEETKEEQLRCEENIKVIKKRLENAVLPKEKEYAPEVVHYKGETAQMLREKSVLLKQEQEEVKEAYYALSLALAKQTAQKRSLSDIESDLHTVTDEIAELEKQYAAYQQAALWMEKAHTEIRQNFAPRLNKKTAEIFSHLTDGKYKDVRVGDEFCINFQNESGEIVEADYLSSGTYDLLYIALRLAMKSEAKRS